MSKLHHVCISTKEYDWYVSFFTELLGMTVERTAKEAPSRTLWFVEGIQINEMSDAEVLGSAVHHISIAVDDIPATVVQALARGCSPLSQGEHWFALPDGIRLELKPL